MDDRISMGWSSRLSALTQEVHDPPNQIHTHEEDALSTAELPACSEEDGDHRDHDDEQYEAAKSRLVHHERANHACESENSEEIEDVAAYEIAGGDSEMAFDSCSQGGGKLGQGGAGRYDRHGDHPLADPVSPGDVTGTVNEKMTAADDTGDSANQDGPIPP